MSSDLLHALVFFLSSLFSFLEHGFDLFESAVRIFFDDFGGFVHEFGKFVVPVSEDFDFEVIHTRNGQAHAAAFANAVEELCNFWTEEGEVKAFEIFRFQENAINLIVIFILLGLLLVAFLAGAVFTAAAFVVEVAVHGEVFFVIDAAVVVEFVVFKIKCFNEDSLCAESLGCCQEFLEVAAEVASSFGFFVQSLHRNREKLLLLDVFADQVGNGFFILSHCDSPVKK